MGQRHSLQRFADGLQRVASLVCRRKHLLDLGRSHVAGVGTAHASTIEVDAQHDLGSSFAVFTKKLLQHDDDELHGSVVVVEHDHLVHAWRIGALGAPLHHHGAAIIHRRRRPRGLRGRSGGLSSHEIDSSEG